MKYIKLLISILFILFITDSSLSQSNSNDPLFSFKENSYDFGTVVQGDKVSHKFEFTNTGKTPLVISDVITTCGCTAPSWPKEPVMPGKKGEIKITFDSTGKIGKQNKIVTILSNSEEKKTRLMITASVIPSG